MAEKAICLSIYAGRNQSEEMSKMDEYLKKLLDNVYSVWLYIETHIYVGTLRPDIQMQTVSEMPMFAVAHVHSIQRVSGRHWPRRDH